VVLSEGATFERSAGQGDRHSFEASLTAGDFVEIEVSQNQLAIGIAVRGPDGAELHEINLPEIDPMAERLMFVAPVSGRHIVEVFLEAWVIVRGPVHKTGWIEGRKRGPEDSQRTFVLHVAALRPATPADRARARAFELLERGAKLAMLQTMDGLRQSIPMFWEAAAGWRAAGDAPLELSTLEALASLTGLFSQFGRESAAARERLAELYAASPEREWEVVNWASLANAYFNEGRLVDAKRAVGRALDLALVGGFRASAARSQRELGYYEFELGNYDRAREQAHRTQALAAEIDDKALEAMAMWDLARLDDLAGDFEAAIVRNRLGLDLALASGNSPAVALITLWLGLNHLRRGELDEAASSFEARLGLAPKYVQREQETHARLGLGDVMLARGDREAARQRYEAVAAALERGAPRWRCIGEQRLGRMDLEDGRLDQARARFETMLEIARQRQNPPCEAEARAGLADVAARRDDLEIAETEARRVVELTETFREAAVSLESRSLGFGALAPAYERAIEISMRRAAQGDGDASARALMLHERALARGLLDRVSEARLDSRARLPPTLAAERAQVRERWRGRLAQLQVSMRTRPDAPETKALIDETSALAVKVRDVEARIDASDVRHALFLRSQPLGVKAIQSLLDDDTLLLEYALGSARSYLWVVSPRDIRALTLPPRAEIEALARRVHEGLARSPAGPASARRAGEEDLRALTRLLIEPAAPQLAARRLVLVVAGALSLIPFGALPQPGTAVHPLPMLAKHEIVQVPSATILGAMRTLTAGRARPARTAAIFADPIFDAHDPRVHARTQSAGIRRAAPSDAPRVRGVTLTRLPFSRGEAEAIRSLASRRVSTFMGSEATRERALARALYDYRFSHFATHGIVNQDVPSLSSLVLSLVDGAGRPRDGFVMVPDIYDMTLNADVVVLSGCQTALGKQIRGEGPIGLARAFMYAGVPRVVASLWQVDDLATAELMKRFYRGMLVDELTPAAALRAAQRDLATGRRWASPYFWAPFVLQGDWR
jgi:CHAT domain-containing protein/tetratricopeptide (TPR) repeat protein